jgi:geranylgeranyl diphosphate synthase type II
MKYIEQYKKIINKEINNILTDKTITKELNSSISYILEAPSKKIRALMCFTNQIMYNTKYTKTITRYAISIELFHNALLIYDDIMDKSLNRRGKPSLHKKWNYSRAILTAEYLVMLSLKYLHHNLSSNIIIEKFYRTAMKIYTGQQMDLNFQKKNIIHLKEYLKMIEYKTSSLFVLSLNISFILNKSNSHTMKIIQSIGKNIGILFQINNDLSDITHNNQKTYAEDIIRKKKTILYVKAFTKANEKEKKEIIHWYNHKNKIKRIENVIQIFNHLNIINDIKNDIKIYQKNIQNQINKSNINNKNTLSNIIKTLIMT